jgi:hypothetical protein
MSFDQMSFEQKYRRQNFGFDESSDKLGFVFYVAEKGGNFSDKKMKNDGRRR